MALPGAADDEYFAGELGRRTIEISGLSEDLDDLQGRACEAEERTESLNQAIAKLHTEIALWHVRASDLEDGVVAGHARGEAADRQLRANVDAMAAEVAKLRGSLADRDEALGYVHEGTEAATADAERLEMEVASTRARLEVLRLDAVQAKKELLREQEEAEDREARLLGEARGQAERRLEEAEADLQAGAADLAVQQQEVAKLRMGLALEKECTNGLATALRHTEARSELVAKEGAALRREAEALQSRKSEDSMRDALAVSKNRYLQLTQELASSKRESSMQTQSIEGALEETKRILLDHAEQKQRRGEEKSTEASPLAALAAALSELRHAAETATAARHRTEAECSSLELEVGQVRAADRELQQLGCTGRIAELEASVAATREELEACSRTAAVAQQEEMLASTSHDEAERQARYHETLLRRKLTDLWAALGQVRPETTAQRNGGFAVGPSSSVRASPGLGMSSIW